MRSAYRIVAHCMLALVAVQAAAIAYAWFAVLHDVEDGATFTSATPDNAGQMVHAGVGMLAPVLALALLVLAFVVKVPGAVRWAGILLAVVLVQFGLGEASVAAPVLGVLHGLGAVAIAVVALLAGRSVREPVSASA